ncbi:unnamed protein product [Clonostachys rhizophaga]|uniref:Cytochrome P450 n=1 Tax=Clonostachys rhizophaga TaxID=160324 RepID=A0A9N9V1K8_9HYPO|nr:unnamed protein product [Clonostachys rhizophaga]
MCCVLEQRTHDADAFLQPVVTQRKKAQAAEGDDYQKPDDILQWIIDSQKFGQDDKNLAKLQLPLSFGAIHTTTLAATNAFYTLAAMPHLVPMLREDVQQALQQSGGQFTSLAMQNMKKLDSFLKESMRCHPMSASSFQRKVLKSFALSSGQVIPKGQIIEIAAGSVSKDSEFFEDLETFDALRFHKMRETKQRSGTGRSAAEIVANSQFVSVGTSSLAFGYGRHACPGRFFAANEIKMVVATALLHYEMKMPDGVEGRYENLKMGSQVIIPYPHDSKD